MSYDAILVELADAVRKGYLTMDDAIRISATIARREGR